MNVHTRLPSPFTRAAFTWLWQEHPRRARFALARGIIGVACLCAAALPGGALVVGVGLCLLLSVLPGIRDAGRGTVVPPALLLTIDSKVAGARRLAYEVVSDDLGPTVVAVGRELEARLGEPRVALVSAAGDLVESTIDDALGQGEQPVFVSWGDPAPPTQWPAVGTAGIWLRLDPLPAGWTARFVADAGRFAATLEDSARAAVEVLPDTGEREAEQRDPGEQRP